MKATRKVYAYITRGRQLLVLSHPDSPEAGIQVPGGTVEPGETPQDAVMREAFEETGLKGLTLAAALGEQRYDRRDDQIKAIHHRFFYHLIYEGDTPDRWRTFEETPSDGTPGPIMLEMFWVDLPDGVPDLIADMGFKLDKVIQRLKLDDLLSDS